MIVTFNCTHPREQDFASNYDVVSIEDPFDQDDWSAYTSFTTSLGEKVQVRCTFSQLFTQASSYSPSDCR